MFDPSQIWKLPLGHHISQCRMVECRRATTISDTGWRVVLSVAAWYTLDCKLMNVGLEKWLKIGLVLRTDLNLKAGEAEGTAGAKDRNGEAPIKAGKPTTGSGGRPFGRKTGMRAIGKEIRIGSHTPWQPAIPTTGRQAARRGLPRGPTRRPALRAGLPGADNGGRFGRPMRRGGGRAEWWCV